MNRRAPLSPDHPDQTLDHPVFEVRALKYDGQLHKKWTARLVREEGSLIILRGTFDEEIRHNLLGTIEKGTISTEFYWLDRFYSIFEFVTPEGQLRNYYCNINLPPVYEHQTLSYVDLDIDVLVAPDLSYRILDLDEFERHAGLYGYSIETRERVHASLAELMVMIRSRLYPFSHLAKSPP